MDTRVYRSVYLESDHELVLSKARRSQPAGRPHPQTQSLPSEVKAAFTCTLADSLGSLTDIESSAHGVKLAWAKLRGAWKQLARPSQWLLRGLRRTGLLMSCGTCLPQSPQDQEQ
jgi:hypothetical protein